MTRARNHKNRRPKTAQNGPPKTRQSAPPRAPVLPREPVDAGVAAGESGAAGGAAPGRPHDPQGEERVSPARTIARARPETGDEGGRGRPLVRPYRFRLADSAAQALEFSHWFQEQRQQAVGVAFHGASSRIGFANAEDGWQVNLDSPLLLDALGTALRLTAGEDPVYLLFQDAQEAVPALLAQFPFLDPKILLRALSGDLQVLQDAVGRRIEQGHFVSPADEAYAVYTAEQHWGGTAPPFYHAVGLPWLCQRIYYSEHPPEGVPWRIVYSDLFLRIIAHMTREPRLVAAFTDKTDPVPELEERLELSGEDQVIATVFWAATGFDAVYLSDHHPGYYTRLPVSLDLVRQRCERVLPVLCLWVSEQREDYTRERRLQTLYGRLLLWGLPLAEILAQKLLGSVQDVLDVAETATGSFWGEEPLPVYTPVFGNHLDRVLRVRGTAPDDRGKWLPILEGVAHLNNPLNVPLDPVVVWADP